MFWKKKNKCPVTAEDKEWIEEKLTWVDTNMIDLIRQPTVLPTKRYFDIDFSGKEQDAFDTLDIICDYFQVNPNRISLEFYSEESIQFDPGTQSKSESGTAGLYFQDGDENTIMIEKSQLNMPNSLIATIAHELSHYIIMEEKGYYFEEVENEYLTDLTAIAYGFGIFLGNIKFRFNQWQFGDGWGGWSSSTQGYLPQQIIAYTMAEIQKRKNNLQPTWQDHLKKDFKKDFMKSLNYIEREQSK